MENPKHEPKLPLANFPSESSDSTFASQLESLYNRYGRAIYTLCLRLIADEKAAEFTTIDVFLKFGKEIASHPDESLPRLRLCELAINASLARLSSRGGMIVRRLRRSLGVKSRRLWR